MPSRQIPSTSTANADINSKTCELVDYNFTEEHARLFKEQKEQIDGNPLLRNNIKCVPRRTGDKVATKNQIERIYKFIRELRTDEKDACSSSKVPELFTKREKKYEEEAQSRKRRLLDSNSTKDELNVIPVYCDLDVQKPLKSCESLNITYSNRNEFALNEKDKNYKKLSRLFEKGDEQRISCGCIRNAEGIVECSKNPDCKCYIANKTLENFRTEKVTGTFSSFGKMYFGMNQRDETAGFSCSEYCACEGACDNNVLLTINANVHKFETYRDDGSGFGVKAKTFIPAGVPVMEFTGEIITTKESDDRKTADYSMDLNATHLVAMLAKDTKSSVIKEVNCKALKEVWKSKWCVDPFLVGNVARFVSHGCNPNLIMRRIFQNGFFPNHFKLVLFSLEDIYPNERLSYFYGTPYLESHLRDTCLCHTIGCKSDASTGSVLAHLEEKDLAKYYKRDRAYLYRHWRKEIFEKSKIRMEEEGAEKVEVTQKINGNGKNREKRTNMNGSEENNRTINENGSEEKRARRKRKPLFDFGC